MKNLPLIITALFTLIIIGLLAMNPNYSAKPGEVSSFHAKISNNCLECHSYFNGIPQEKCIQCHQLKKIGTESNNSSTLKTPFHDKLITTDCLECHTEHNGATAQITASKFDHNFLRASMQSQCSQCHSQPVNKIHNGLNSECNVCHTTSGWKGADFKHSVLPVSKQAECSVCHAKPTDGMHTAFTAECSACHTVTSWKGAVIDHQKYFLFDKDHPQKCDNCHTNPASFKTYTCYNCHEHTPAKIKSKHLEEGINNFENCVKCHRSSDEPKENEHGRENEKKNKHRDRERHEEDED